MHVFVNPQDDPSLHDYNVDDRVNNFLKAVTDQVDTINFVFV